MAILPKMLFSVFMGQELHGEAGCARPADRHGYPRKARRSDRNVFPVIAAMRRSWQYQAEKSRD
jgi:hypothetical protein